MQRWNLNYCRVAARANEKRFDRFNRSIFLMNKTKRNWRILFFFGKLAAFWRRLEASLHCICIVRHSQWRLRKSATLAKVTKLTVQVNDVKKMLLTASEVNYIILRKKTHASHEINIQETDRIDDWPTRKCKTDRQIWHVLI